MDKRFRLVAAKFVVESNLSKVAKQQMLKFIKKEATDSQIKALLMDGKIVKLDEQSEKIVNDRFENHSMNNKEIILAVFKKMLEKSEE